MNISKLLKKFIGAESKAIIVDLDDTLCNTQHRRKSVPPTNLPWGEREYKIYYSKMDKDVVNYWCFEIIKTFKDTHHIIFVTGRPEQYYYETIRWLANKCGLLPYDYELHMRPKDNWSHDTEIKTQIYNDKIKSKYDVSFVIDDRTSVVDNWRKLGLTCLQCANNAW